MKNSILKTIITLAAVLPCLNACNSVKYKEGEKVTAECIYNGFNEPVDFTKSFKLEVKDYKGLEIKSGGDHFYVGNFKVYDSLYLADINGDGHRDFCTEYLRNGNQHLLSFYDMQAKSELYKLYLGDDYSYYLGEKDGLLTIEERYTLRSNDQENKFFRRTGTLLTSKDEVNVVWKNENFTPYAAVSTVNYSDGHGTHGISADDDTSPTGQRRLCETNRTFRIILQIQYGGVLDDITKYVAYEENAAYSINHNDELDLSRKVENGTFMTAYNITFTSEGRYDVKLKIKDVEHIVYFLVDNNRFNGIYF